MLIKNLLVIRSLICCLFVCLFCFACENSLQEINEAVEHLEPNVETVCDVEILYSEEAKMRVKLEGPLLLRHKTKDPFTEFPSGVTVTFFEQSSLQPTSKLTAKYAIRRQKDKETVVRDSVVWFNIYKKERLETEELIWNENTNKVYSDKFVKITTETENIFGEGFEADQNFTNYKIKKIHGQVRIKK